MRMILLAAALSVSGIAMAQTDTATDATADPAAASTTADPNGPMVPPGDGVTQQGTDPNGQAVAPPGANQVVTPVPGAPVVPAANQEAVFTPQAATQDYPACSKTVTDHCVQAYERGRRR